jgi:uncharacterized membrane protein
MECLGTEPFWGASISERQLLLDFGGHQKNYLNPTFKAAAGTRPDYVTSIRHCVQWLRLATFLIDASRH